MNDTLFEQSLAALRRGLPEPETADLAIVTGSGLSRLVEIGEDEESISFSELPAVGQGAVAGHGGRWHIVRLGGRRAHVLRMRRHFYEGVAQSQVIAGVRLLARLGVSRLILTNAAGGLSPRLRVGDLMRVTDHINGQHRNPLIGPNDERNGPRFPDMSEPYDREMGELIDETAREQGIDLKRGVYVALAGPTYETRSEARLWRTLGADAVGMSTVPEVIAARHAGMRVAAISLITNSHVRPQGPTTHEEVLEVGERAGRRLLRLLQALIPRLPP